MQDSLGNSPFYKSGSTTANIERIRIDRPRKAEFRPFTSHLSGFLMLGIYICFASLFFI